MKMKKVYKTAMGKEVDIHQLALINEKSIALGNANLNARGDQIDSRGNIVKKREDLAQEYYRANPKAVRDNIEISEDVAVQTTQPAQTIKAESKEDFETNTDENQQEKGKAKKK